MLAMSTRRPARPPAGAALWAAARSRRLPKEARLLLEDPGNDVFFSAASLWEIVIKAALRKPDFKVDMPLLRLALSEMGFAELPVSAAHAERLATLPPIHKDPFDRMLVAQCLAEPLVLLTNDGVLADYGDVVKVVSRRPREITSTIDRPARRLSDSSA
jgi:PIN domain nuclease of toxin-antitoxin system